MSSPAWTHRAIPTPTCPFRQAPEFEVFRGGPFVEKVGVGQLCGEPATREVLTPAGLRLGAYCEQHAEQIVAEKNAAAAELAELERSRQRAAAAPERITPAQARARGWKP